MIRRTTSTKTTKPTKTVTENSLTATKRTKTGKDEISPELSARIESTPPGGLSDDDAFWFNDPHHIAPPRDAGLPPKKPKAKKYADAVTLSAEEWPWVAALNRLDHRHGNGDAGPLGQLLKTGCEPSPRIEIYIEDFIQRHLARGVGRGKTPAYRLSENDALLMIAAENVRAYVQRGLLPSADDALDKVEKEWAWAKLNKSTLADVYNGNHASLNRHRKRL